MSAAEHVGCIPGQCRAGDQWRATGCGAEVDGATWGGGPSAVGALTEAERESLLTDDLALSNLHAAWAQEILFAAVERILAARSQRPEVSEELAFYRKGWAEARAVLAYVADRLDEFTYDEFATVLDDGPADDAADYPAQRPEGVTVDPDSPRQVQRLADHLIAAMCRQDPDWDKSRAYEIRSHLATALREYAAEVSGDTEAGGDRG